MLNAEQQKAFELVKTGHNVFISGSAGTGKSFLINEIRNYSIMNFINCAITASTGIASTLIEGVTLHSFAGMGIVIRKPDIVFQMMKYYYKNRWCNLHILIIDEISMLNAEYFEMLSNTLKLVRKNSRPFGGLQCIFLGDFLQLPPVKSKFVFQTDSWKECNLKHINLVLNMRQLDPLYCKILLSIRNAVVNDEIKEILNRYVRPIEYRNGIKPTILYPTKDSVMNYNITELKKLGNIKVFTSNMIVNGEIYNPEEHVRKHILSQTQCMLSLPIAVNAQVMLIKNLDVINGLANGSRGVVTNITEDEIEVKFLNDMCVKLKRESFEVKYNGKVINIYQFPLILAYAITIHKCQGLTLDYVELDLENCFEYGMAYVALSRVRTLNGLFIKNIDYDKIKSNPVACKYYRKLDKYDKVTDKHVNNFIECNSIEYIS